MDLRMEQLLGGLITWSIRSIQLRGPNDEKKGWSLVNTPSGSMASRMGFEPGFLVLESGHGDDSDEVLRKEIIQVTGSQFISGPVQEVVDAVVLWWRDDDGDLVDALVDVLAYLTDGGPIWVLTPKVGRRNHVEPSDIQDAAPTAGLSQTSTLSVAPDWSATRLVARKAGKR